MSAISCYTPSALASKTVCGRDIGELRNMNPQRTWSCWSDLTTCIECRDKLVEKRLTGAAWPEWLR